MQSPRLIQPRFSIGIDLGTTNTALAFVALDRDDPAELLAIPQLESQVAIVEAATLPSFLYLPEVAGAAAPADDSAADDRWVIGRFARAKASEMPGRVVHSAKSWLIHHSADRTARFLPWGSDDVGREEMISPVGAAALILRYLREAWNDRFIGRGDDFAFDAQVITITVPASFDAVAQRLTLSAAQDAGYPQTVRLLEEPQAALYCWLELHASAGDLDALTQGRAEPLHILVVDIGGGTSDFSMFAFRPNGADSAPHIKRIAVSEHILLGGDNMDLALAHRLEPRFVENGESLAGRQWEHLVSRARDLKEAALSTDGAADDAFTVSIPGRGSRLIAQAQSAQLSRAEIETVLLDGFFPACGADEYPVRTTTALREFGLPYARDPAITRHLADFLRDRPTIDAVLFNGGSLHPPRLRQRICSQIEEWQSGQAPVVLENHEPDLAVARGATRFGKLVSARAERIEAGSAHAIFLQAHRASAAPASAPVPLVCVLPQGAPAEKTFAVTNLALELRVNRPVRFQPYSSARHAAERVGDIVNWSDGVFHALPALETLIDAGGASTIETIPVHLNSRVSELGRLEISCVSADPALRSAWPLEFNLRLHETTKSVARPVSATAMSAKSGPNVSDDALDAAQTRIRTLFARPIDNRDRLTATRLLKSLEKLLGIAKSDWNVVLVRSLWATLEQCMVHRAQSVEHEEAWLILAGFLLRPGFGAAMDEMRIDRLWTLRESGLSFKVKTLKIQEYVLWRRVAGGLSAERQESVLLPELAKLRELLDPPPELVLLAGSLERINPQLKSELIERFVDVAATLERDRKHSTHFLAALGFLLNRAPLYAGPETVVSPDLVQHVFDAFARFDWDGSRRIEFQALFLRAARAVNNRSIDVARSLRNRIADKLEKSGVAPARTAPLRDYMPMQRHERAGNFGESLPPGLVLRDGAAD